MQILGTELKETELGKKIFHLSYLVQKKVTQTNLQHSYMRRKTKGRTRKKNWTV